MEPEWFSAEILASEWVGKKAKETEWWITFTAPWEKMSIPRESKTDQK